MEPTDVFINISRYKSNIKSVGIEKEGYISYEGWIEINITDQVYCTVVKLTEGEKRSKDLRNKPRKTLIEKLYIILMEQNTWKIP